MLKLDLPLKSQVFLINCQQDLQMLNLTKLSSFWDTLFLFQVQIIAILEEKGSFIGQKCTSRKCAKKFGQGYSP